MQQQTIPDHHQLGLWLNTAGIDFHHCGHCQGLHLDHIQAEPAVLDATLEIDQQVLFMTALAEIRPSRLLALHSEVNALNNEWPQLKLFIDVNDETLPTLVACHNLALGAGVSGDQVIYFVQTLSRQLRELMQWCHKEGYLLAGEHETPPAPSVGAPQALH